MDRRLFGIIVLCTTSIVLFIYHSHGFPSSVFGPYIYGFLVEPFTVPHSNPLRIEAYIANQHRQSPLYISFVNVVQEMTGLTIWWLAVPAAAVIGISIIALLRNVPLLFRILVAIVAIGGPVNGLSYSFGRNGLDILLTFTFVIFVFVTVRNKRPRLVGLAGGVAALVLWLNHYSYWPFFIGFAVTLLVIPHCFNLKSKNVYVAFVFLFVPIGVYTFPFRTYISATLSASALLAKPEKLLQQFLIFAGGQSASGSFEMYTNVPTQPSPDWVPFLMFGYLIAVAMLCLFWLWVHRDDMFRLSRWKKLLRRRPYQFFFGVVAGLLTVVPLYLVIGYIYRVYVFWPLVITALGYTLFSQLSAKGKKLTQSYSGIIVVSLLVLLFSLHFFPAIAPGYDQDKQAASRVNAEQHASAEFSGQYIPNDKPVYTDLIHASTAIIETDRRYYVGAYASVTAEERLGLGSGAVEMFGGSRLNGGYVLVSHQEHYGTRTWGGILPPVPADVHLNKSQIYTSGKEGIYKQ